jgi:hypothetical protein
MHMTLVACAQERDMKHQPNAWLPAPPWGASMGASGGHKQPPQHVTTCTAALSHMHRCAQTCTAQLSCSRPRDLTVANPPQNPHTFRKLTMRRYQKPEGGWARLNYDLFRILSKLSSLRQHVNMSMQRDMRCVQCKFEGRGGRGGVDQDSNEWTTSGYETGPPPSDGGDKVRELWPVGRAGTGRWWTRTRGGPDDLR